MKAAAALAPPHAAEPAPLPTVVVDGLPFVAASVEAVSAHICAAAAAGQGGWVVTPNLDILRRWRREPAFRTLVGGASLFTPDGWPIVWASRLQGTPLPGRIAGSDLFVDLYLRAARAGLPMLLIGGNPGTAAAAAARLDAQAGVAPGRTRSHCPALGFEQRPDELAAIGRLLEETRPRLVFVGLGSPKQEQLIERLRRARPEAWYLGVGVSFSFVAGDVKRAPRWAQRLGFEWLHRLVQEPTRLARRYLVDGLPFAAQLLLRSALRRREG